MKRLLLLIAFLGTISSIGAQTGENLFEWQGKNAIVAKSKFLKIAGEQELPDMPMYTYLEYEVHSDDGESYTIKIRGLGRKEMPSIGTYNFFKIHHNGKIILRYNPYDQLYDCRYLTVDTSKDYFFKVPLSSDSFALFLAGWLFGSGGETPEMIVVIVSGGNAKVVFEDYAYAYKYTPGENFSMEYVDDINGLNEIGSQGFTASYLKQRMKYKIWRDGDMLKYTSWK